jgi:DNA repair exonuclease SbcCD ATPase subunit
MDIASGLSALKSGFDISRTINQRIKEGKSYPNEIADQLFQLQQLMLDSQRSLNDAAEEIRALKEQIASREQVEQIRLDMEWVEDGGFWIRKSEKDSGVSIRYCPLCWGESAKLVPLNPTGGEGFFRCALHKSSHETEAYRQYVRQQSQRHAIRSEWA